jgi:hypothetical protein
MIGQHLNMSNVFEQDEEMWAQSSTPIEVEIYPWSFGNDNLHVGNNIFKLQSLGNHRTALELAIFDIHFTYWMSRRKYIGGKLQYSHNFNYHCRLRSAIENHFRQREKDSSGWTNPEVLKPWLWRTFSLCPHTPNGRNKFKELSTRHSLKHSLRRPPHVRGS